MGSKDSRTDQLTGASKRRQEYNRLFLTSPVLGSGLSFGLVYIKDDTVASFYAHFTSPPILFTCYLGTQKDIFYHIMLSRQIGKGVVFYSVIYRNVFDIYFEHFLCVTFIK